MRKKILIFATYSLADPPIQNTIASFLNKSWQVVVVLQSDNIPGRYQNSGVKIYRISDFTKLALPRMVRPVISWLVYWLRVRIILSREKPDHVIAEMHRPLSAIPKKLLLKTTCFIPDIPSVKFAGKLDKFILRYGWRHMKNCLLIWASDTYKAELTKEFAGLDYVPFVCHNCPSLDYLQGLDKKEAREWLTNKLKENGIVISSDTVILLRAGAVGPYGGIEETIQAIKGLPPELIFVLMGRPDRNFKDKLKKIISKSDLSGRVYLFDRPDDAEWQTILLASDIGHLIHVRPNDNPAAASVYDLNSSLSNNRLFQYMAAGLPVISYQDKRMTDLYAEVNCFTVIDTSNITEGLTLACTGLFTKPDKRRKMGKAGRNVFVSTYNWENQFAHILAKI